MKEGCTIYLIEKAELQAKLEILSESLLSDYEKCLNNRDLTEAKLLNLYMALRSGVLAAIKEIENCTEYKANFKENKNHIYK